MLKWTIIQGTSAVFENIYSRISRVLLNPGSATCSQFDPYGIAIFVGQKWLDRR